MPAFTDFHLGWEYMVLCYRVRRFLWWRWRERTVFHSGNNWLEVDAAYTAAFEKYGNAFLYRMSRGVENTDMGVAAGWNGPDAAT